MHKLQVYATDLCKGQLVRNDIRFLQIANVNYFNCEAKFAACGETKFGHVRRKIVPFLPVKGGVRNPASGGW